MLSCCRGCWWQWNASKPSAPEAWTMIIHGAEPCVGFQVMHTMTDRQAQVDLTRTAVKLPNISAERKKGNGALFPVSADSKTWLVRAELSSAVGLWLSGDTSVKGTIQVCNTTVCVVNRNNLMCTAHCINIPDTFELSYASPGTIKLQATNGMPCLSVI